MILSTVHHNYTYSMFFNTISSALAFILFINLIHFIWFCSFKIWISSLDSAICAVNSSFSAVRYSFSYSNSCTFFFRSFFLKPWTSRCSSWVPFRSHSIFYQFDDETRPEVVETIRLKLQYHRDPERAEQIKQIKGW